ncbi:MAG: glycerophosphodiester phosphodiesterase [Parabacteroides distasonis]|nr:glycerophosphodiester phosphodiesterase [Parabacteroides distasonis]
MKKYNLFLSCLLIVLSLLSCVETESEPKVKVIAHRGYWNTEGSAQNSIRAIELADEIKAYGSEFDVHLTSDNVLVVFHDRKIDSIDIQQTPYADLKNITIANGEKIPTLDQLLERAKSLKHTKLIFELKSHSTPERDREAAKYSVDMINEKGLTKQTEYIAFSLEAAKELHRLSPETPVYYLNGDLSPKELKDLGLAGLDYHYGVMRKNPNWFKEAKDLGLKINIWTVNKPEIMKEMIDAGADFITTDEPELLQQVIREHCK